MKVETNPVVNAEPVKKESRHLPSPVVNEKPLFLIGGNKPFYDYIAPSLTGKPHGLMLSFVLTYMTDFRRGKYEKIRRAMADVFARGASILAVDSGAFSLRSKGSDLDIDLYADFVKTFQNDASWFVSLDDLNDIEKSRKNYEYLRNKGVEVVPVIHVGEPTELIDYYAEMKPKMLGYGGFTFHYDDDQLYHRILHDLYTEDGQYKYPGMELHGLGILSWKSTFQVHWRSVDSTTPLRIAAFGSIYGGLTADGKYKYFKCSSRSYIKEGLGDVLPTEWIAELAASPYKRFQYNVNYLIDNYFL